MDSVSSTYANSDFYNTYRADATSSTSSTTDTTSKGSPKVEDTFMELLLAELRHQNPMEPMDSAQMVTQMTQMNSLQELQKITASLQDANQSNQFFMASSLIGKNVTYRYEDYVQTGMVSSFTIDKDVINLLVNDQAISLKDIISVTAMDEAQNV